MKTEEKILKDSAIELGLLQKYTIIDGHIYIRKEIAVHAIQQVKNLNIPAVSQQRELLLAFAKYANKYIINWYHIRQDTVDEFLKANNCG